MNKVYLLKKEKIMSDWLLPQYLQDILAPATHQLEHKRRQVLDLYMSWGYQLIIPPLQEFQSSLAGAGADIDNNMLKVVDLMSGKMLALRPDITPQAARIDAHIYEGKGISRLCYCDKVLHAIPVHQFASREPITIGAEIYGLSDSSADVELINLLDNSIRIIGIKTASIEFHHMGIIRELLELVNKNLDNKINEELWLEVLQTKSKTGLDKLLSNLEINLKSLVCEILNLYGNEKTLLSAQKIFSQYADSTEQVKKIQSYIEELINIFGMLKAINPQIIISVDLADARGYKYHSGLMYAVFVPNWSNALANGGRYDGYGDRYGAGIKNRPASGFTIDLLETYSYFQKQTHEENDSQTNNQIFIRRVFVESKTYIDKKAQNYVENLRSQGIAVIVGNNLDRAKEHNCVEVIVRDKNDFKIIKL